MTQTEIKDQSRIELRRSVTHRCPRCGSKRLKMVNKYHADEGNRCCSCGYYQLADWNTTPPDAAYPSYIFASYAEAPYIPPGAKGSHDKPSDHGLSNEHWWDIHEGDAFLTKIAKSLIIAFGIVGYGIVFLLGLAIIVLGVYIFRLLMLGSAP